MGLSADDLRALLAVVQEVSAVDDPDAFAARALAALATLVPCDVASYNEVDPTNERFVSVSRPADFAYPPDVFDRFTRHRAEHPLIAHYEQTGDGRALRISDFLDRAAYHATDLYREVYRDLGVEYQISITLPAPQPLVVAFALSRHDRDFTDRERDLLDAARPHLAQAYLHAREYARFRRRLAVLTGATEDRHVAVVHCSPDGSLHAHDPAGQRLVDRWFGPGSTLAVDLRAWLQARREQARETAGPGAASREPYRVTSAEGLLLVRWLGTDGKGERLAIEDAPFDVDGLRRLGLAPREAEVLGELVGGATNAEIATILGTSRGTVKKQLERIYAKLGVHDRRAAAALALDALEAVRES